MKRKGKKNRVIMQIKGDIKQNLKAKESRIKQLEKIYDNAKEQIPLLPEAYQKSKESINTAYNRANEILQFDQGRADFHVHAVVANRNDQLLFHKYLADIHDELSIRNEKYKEEIQRLQFEKQEMVNKLKSEIESLASQLKSLSPFQERRKILIEQKKDLENLISKEKQIHQDELTKIHHELLDQREYYENDLRTRLETANSFAKRFADLHIDLLTKKIHDTTLSKRKELNSLETKLLNELYNIDNLMKTKNFYTRRNKILHKNIEDTTAQIIKLKQEKKDTEIKMLQTMSDHEKEISEIKDFIQNKESDIINLKLAKLREINFRFKYEASVAFELMKKAEESRSPNKKSFESDLLQIMKKTSEYIIKALEDKFGVADDPVYLSQKTPMRKLIRRLMLIKKEIKSIPNSTANQFYDTETVRTSNYSNSRVGEDIDLETNVDIPDFNEIIAEANELSDISRSELFDSNNETKNSEYEGSSYIEQEEIEISEESRLKCKKEENGKNSYINQETSKTTENTSKISDNENIICVNNKSHFTPIVKVSVAVQTEKPIRSNLLKGIKAPPTPPNYPYQFRSELPKSQNSSKFDKFQNIDRRRRNYFYYTYATKSATSESEPDNDERDDATFSHLKPANINGETFTPKPPKIPISSQSKSLRKLRNENQIGQTLKFDQKANLENCETSNLSRPSTPRRKNKRKNEYEVTPEFRRVPSVHIRVIRATE